MKFLAVCAALVAAVAAQEATFQPVSTFAALPPPGFAPTTHTGTVDGTSRFLLSVDEFVRILGVLTVNVRY
jgi:hypothetical protein